MFRPLSPSELLARELEKTLVERIEATSSREHYTALEEMLRRREARLRREIADMAQQSSEAAA